MIEAFEKIVNLEGHAISVERLLEIGAQRLRGYTETQAKQVIAEIKHGVPLGTSVEGIEDAVEQKVARLQARLDEAEAQLHATDRSGDDAAEAVKDLQAKLDMAIFNGRILQEQLDSERARAEAAESALQSLQTDKSSVDASLAPAPEPTNTTETPPEEPAKS